jgi:hypothetical protein
MIYLAPSFYQNSVEFAVIITPDLSQSPLGGVKIYLINTDINSFTCCNPPLAGHQMGKCQMQIAGAGDIAGGVNNMSEGHQIVCNLYFVFCNFPRRGLTLLAGFHFDILPTNSLLRQVCRNPLSPGFDSDEITTAKDANQARESQFPLSRIIKQ